MELKVTFENLLELIEKNDSLAIAKITKAYNYACSIHGNQKRKSGELYITHPLCVAYMLAIMKADCDTICAAILHDVIEDGDNITKEDIANEFNETIAILVDGVTKMKLELFPNKEAQNSANTRKIITGMKKDVRIIIIKLIDRLHNMMTIEYLPRNKQIQNSLETLKIFVPIAKRLGLHKIKNMLEELAFKNLNKDIYDLIEEKKEIYTQTKLHSIEQTKKELETKLDNLNINNTISYRFKRNYSIYKEISLDKDPTTLLKLNLEDISQLLNLSSSNIHDLQSLKIIVENLEDCYLSLELLQKQYKTIPGKIKDCILTPKTNGYQSLHTTILDNQCDQLQTQIRTNDMETRDQLGIALYWQTNPELAPFLMNQELYSKFPFFKSLLEIDKIIANDKEFVEQVKFEILSEMIYPYTKDGKILELPFGATIMDFACHQLTKINNKIIAIVNGEEVSLNYILKSKDTVDLITILNQKPPEISYNVVTTKAKQKIRSLQG